MIKDELQSKLLDVIYQCDSHSLTISFARENLSPMYPFSPELISFNKKSYLTYTDQLVFRFSKLQDKMGVSLFPLTLQCLDEVTTGYTMTDILNRLEKLSFIKSADLWRSLRETRNIISHDYPSTIDETAIALNKVWEDSEVLISVYNHIKNELNLRGWNTSPQPPASL